MPKIRGIKPDTWTDDKFVELSPLARLLFIGLWNYACDNGHLEDKSKQIKMRLLPAEDCNVAELLRELEEAGRITRSEGCITIPRFTHHQRIDRRYFTTCARPDCLKPDDSQPETRRAPHVSTTGSRRKPAVDTTGPRVDGEGDSEGDGDRANKPRKRATQLPTDFKPADKHIQLATSLGVDLRREWPKFCDHHRAKGSTFKDWSAALNSWIRKAAEFGNVRPLQRPQADANGNPVLPPLPTDDKR